MKVLHLSTYDTSGGAARAACRLHKGLLTGGIDSQMLVQDKLGNDTTIIGSQGNFGKFSGRYLRPRIDTLPIKVYRHHSTSPFHFQWIPSTILRKIKAIDPDIVHLHWINDGMISIEELSNINKPIIWTLHDMWPFTGGCHYAGECIQFINKCGNCPQLDSNCTWDLSRFNLIRKNRSWSNSDISIITPSHWLSECARNSFLFRNNRIEIIPNGIDLDLFHPISKVIARKVLKLPENNKIILFGAVRSTSDRRKGFHFLQPALKKLSEEFSEKIELVIFGASKPVPAPDFSFDCRYIGALNDEISLAILYSAADLFICPSLEDNLPNTIVESLACGTPCVAFNIGGMPDMIGHMKNGYLSEPYNPIDLAHGIKWILSDPIRHASLALTARSDAEKSFDIKKTAQRYLSLYTELLNPRKDTISI